MSRYIDADALKIPETSVDMFENCRNCGLLDKEQVQEIINSAPSIDIVRCDECKHKQQCRKAVEHITHEITSVTIAYRPIDFCSYGEREGE